LAFQPRRVAQKAASFSLLPAGLWTFREEAGQRPVLTIIGGGHVGLALSRVMAGLDFHVRVLDDRAGLATLAANVYAQETHVVSYRGIGRHVEEGERSYAVIMTYGHLADEKVLAQLAVKKLRYLGLLGSPAKNARIFARLRKKGVTAAQLRKVHAPVGLPIHSHTPEEIAISIAAEIISIKNQEK
jgi:xanthine dehydrogenase accessory factor